MEYNGTMILYPSFVDTKLSTWQSIDSNYPLENCLNVGEDNENFARIYMNTGGAAGTMLYLGFDFSKLPKNVSVQNLAITAKGRMENDSIMKAGSNRIFLTKGNSYLVRSESRTTFGTSASSVSINCAGITNKELQSFRFQFAGWRGYLNTNSTYYMDFFGCSLKVEWSKPTSTIFIKENGEWVQSTQQYYKNSNGVWINSNRIEQFLIDENDEA